MSIQDKTGLCFLLGGIHRVVCAFKNDKKLSESIVKHHN
jgi:hypothetical protein